MEMNIKDFIKAMTPDVPDIKLPSIDDIKDWELEKRRILSCFGTVNCGDEGEEVFYTRTIKNQIIRYNLLDDMNNVPIEKRTPIILAIDSCGGDLWGTWSLVQTIKVSKTPVYTINLENAASAGGIILMAGHKRFALPGTQALIHSGAASISGDQEKFESAQKMSKKLTKKTVDFILANTKCTKKDYDKFAPRDWYFFDDEQVTYGLVDKIVTDFSEIFEPIGTPILKPKEEEVESAEA